MNYYLSKSLNKNHSVIIVILCICMYSKSRRVIKYISIMIYYRSIKICKLITLSLLIILAFSGRIQAYQNISHFPDCVNKTGVATCFSSKMDTPVLDKFGLQLASIQQNSNLINLNKKNYRKKIILLHQNQNNKNKNVIYNASAKPTLGEIIFKQKLLLKPKLLVEPKKLNTTVLLKKIVCNVFLVSLIKNTFSQHIVSSFYLLFYKQNISFVKTFILFITQEKVFSNNYFQNSYQNSCETYGKEKPKFIIVHGPIYAFNYKVGNKVFLTCDLKKYNLHCGDEGFIIDVTKNTNKIFVSFELDQALKPLHFRQELHLIVSLFLLQV